ncbi:DUF3244 domain-containing protein [Paludibacter sp.]|uniref:DUF3244 domain-containing protein n=1 Tax=Paludibacter sp. TaxID=1898105 RepID=UPI00135509FC|nr:DUF3244 domain-containing protein [Paludibacter sp.]
MRLRKFILLWGVIVICVPVQFINGESPENPNPPLKSKSISACSVQLSTDNVTLYFNLNLSTVTVSVEDMTDNLLYDTYITTMSGSSLTIDTTGWARGIYTLTVTNDIGVIYLTNIDIP